MERGPQPPSLTEFSACQTEEDIVRKLLAQVGVHEDAMTPDMLRSAEDWSECAYDFNFIVPAITRLTLIAHNNYLATQCRHRLRLEPAGAFRMYNLYGTLCCKHCAVRRGAVYASQQRSARGRAALQVMRLRHFLGGWAGRSPSKPSLMHKRTYRRLINQLRELDAVARHCRPIKASHWVIKPTCMYRTQIAAVAQA